MILFALNPGTHYLLYDENSAAPEKLFPGVAFPIGRSGEQESSPSLVLLNSSTTILGPSISAAPLCLVL